MTTARKDKLHALIRTAILFLFAYYISDLVKSGNIDYYLAPRMVRYEKWAVIALFIVALVQLYETLTLFFNQKQAQPACDCCEEHKAPSSLKRFLVYVLFVIPLAAGFMLPDTELGSAVVAQKGIQLGGDAIIGTAPGQAIQSEPLPDAPAPGTDASPEQLAKLFPNKLMQVFANYGMQLYKQPSIEVSEKQYMETLATLNLYLDNYVGKEIKISGFVYHLDSLGGNQYVLGRLGVGCCAADATPVGVIIEGDQPMKLNNDTWLTITGTIGKAPYNNQQILKITPSKVETIQPPKKGFYVYRDSSFYLSS